MKITLISIITCHVLTFKNCSIAENYTNVSTKNKKSSLNIPELIPYLLNKLLGKNEFKLRCLNLLILCHLKTRENCYERFIYKLKEKTNMLYRQWSSQMTDT